MTVVLGATGGVGDEAGDTGAVDAGGRPVVTAGPVAVLLPPPQPSTMRETDAAMAAAMINFNVFIFFENFVKSKLKLSNF